MTDLNKILVEVWIIDRKLEAEASRLNVSREQLTKISAQLDLETRKRIADLLLGKLAHLKTYGEIRRAEITSKEVVDLGVYRKIAAMKSIIKKLRP